MMQTNTGKITYQGPDNQPLFKASWSPNSQNVVWTSYALTNKPYYTYMLNIMDNNQTDLTNRFLEIFGNDYPEYEPLWLPSSQYLIGFKPKLGGYLIKLEPFECRFIGKKLQKSSKYDAQAIKRQPDESIISMRIFTENSMGWAIIDYQGNILEYLTGIMGNDLLILPKCGKFILVQEGNKIVIKKIK